jgi:hypothetical protein
LRRDTPLWTSPKCGAKFVTRNTYHACGDYSVEKSLEGEGPIRVLGWLKESYKMGEQQHLGQNHIAVGGFDIDKPE